MESRIKIKSSLNTMKSKFKDSNSPYYFIKYYDGADNYKNDDNEIIMFDCLIRHNEIGNRRIARTAPYTFETLESTLEEKCKEYEKELEESKLEL